MDGGPICKKNCRRIYSVEENKTAVCIESQSLKILHSNVPSYTIKMERPLIIYRLSFSGVSPNVIYIVVCYIYVRAIRAMFSLCTDTLTITEITMDKTMEMRYCNELLCHGEYLYFGCTDDNGRSTVFKCIIENHSTLKVLNSYHSNDESILSAVDKEGKLYCIKKTSGEDYQDIVTIDGDTMNEISSISDYCVETIAVNTDGTLIYLQYADDEVKVWHYDRNGERSFKYLEVMKRDGCLDPIFVQTTKCGYFIVGCGTKLALLTNNLQIESFIKPSLKPFKRVKCSPLDNTLAIVKDNTITLLQPEKYLPSFSLTTLCVSAVLKHSAVLLATYLPVGLQRLLMNYITL